MPGAFLVNHLFQNYLLIGMQSSDLFKHQSFNEINNFFLKNNLCYIGHTFEDVLFLISKYIKINQLYLLIKKEYLKN